jgi:hypothetical protein
LAVVTGALTPFVMRASDASQLVLLDALRNRNENENEGGASANSSSSP